MRRKISIGQGLLDPSLGPPLTAGSQTSGTLRVTIFLNTKFVTVIEVFFQTENALKAFSIRAPPSGPRSRDRGAYDTIQGSCTLMCRRTGLFNIRFYALQTFLFIRLCSNFSSRENVPKPFSARVPPGPRLGAYNAFPDPLVGWGGDISLFLFPSALSAPRFCSIHPQYLFLATATPLSRRYTDCRPIHLYTSPQGPWNVKKYRHNSTRF